MYEGECIVCRAQTHEGYGRLGEFTYCPLHVCRSANPTACRGPWTGPAEGEMTPDGTKLLQSVPPERWPYGPPSHHERACVLFENKLYCDCKASDSSDTEHGTAA